MRVLIGTPIHQCKDYCMEQWLQNVAKLQRQTPADLLLVDNSSGTEYTEKVRDYCAKTGVKSYKIAHLELPEEQSFMERLARSREIIRKEILSHDYEAWFSWESDQIIPANSLDELVKMMNAGNFMMVNHNTWTRQLSDRVNTDFGISLIKRECLEKYSFILEFGTDPDMPHNWKFGEAWLKVQVLRDGGSFIEVQGVLNPVYHLDNSKPGDPLPEQAYWDREESR